MRPICIFDLDDTLLESSERFDKAILCILDEEGIAYDAQAVTATILPIGLERTADYFQKVLGVSGSTDEIKRRINEKQLALYQGVFELYGVSLCKGWRPDSPLGWTHSLKTLFYRS